MRDCSTPASSGRNESTLIISRVDFIHLLHGRSPIPAKDSECDFREERIGLHLITMIHPHQPQGKFFQFRDVSEWNEAARSNVDLSKTIRRHKVLVLERSDNYRGFVKIVTVGCQPMPILNSGTDFKSLQVTSTQDPNIDPDLFVPIEPSPKNRKTDMQLKVANVGRTWKLPKRSYLRVDKVYEVPRDVLEPYLHAKVEHVELQLKSHKRLMGFMKARPEDLLRIPAECQMGLVGQTF